VPGWRYDAAATLDFGGGWVTARSGREPTSADLTVALNGVVVDSPEVALSRHPDSEGVYSLVFSATYWARSLATGNPTVSFAAGTFVSPTLGPLGAFSESVMLVDCTLPTMARALLLQTSGYACAASAIACPSDGIWRAAFVLEIVFSEPVFRADGSPVTEADVEIFTVGGVATVTRTYVVQSSGGARRRRLSEAVGMTLMSVGVEISSGATGFEVVQIRPIEGAIIDSSSTWILSHDVFSATGNVLEPFSAQLSAGESAAATSPETAVIPVGVFSAMMLVIIACCLVQNRHRRNNAKARVAPRGWGTWALHRSPGSKPGPDASKPKPKRSRRVHQAAPADSLAIVKQYAWLRAKEPHVELTKRWIDTLADAIIDTLRGVQPSCALLPGVLKTAHVVHSNLGGGHALDDLEALRALSKLLRDGPQRLPESLLMAAASLDTSAAAAMGQFGEAEALSSLQLVLTSGCAVPKAIALGLGDMAQLDDIAQPPARNSYEADAALRKQLATLLQQREWHAYALSDIQRLMPDCLAAFASAGLEQPPVNTDSDAVALVLEMAEMHAQLGAHQREAETRTYRAVEAPYQAWIRTRPGGGFSDLEAANPANEVAQVSMQHNHGSVLLPISR